MKPTYSVIVPVYNEEGNVRKLHQEIVETMIKIGEPYEVVFVNDGSEDDTLEELSDLRPLKIIDFRRNFGQTAAMDAGFKGANGNFFITLDGDGQNPASEIPKLIQKMINGGYDVVSGWRLNRKDSLTKRFISRGANFLRGFFVKDQIHDSGCSLKLYRAECFDGVDLFGEMHRFIPAILRWSGFTIGEVPVEHRPRIHGKTKYNWKRTVKGFIDMLAVWFWRKYAARPLHLFGGFGLLLILVGFGLGVSLVVARFGFEVRLAASNLPLLAVLLVVLGVQFFVSGLLADIAIRSHYRDRPAYAIRDIVENK